MSTAVAYPPGHSSSRQPSNPDPPTHRSSSSPRPFSTIVSPPHSSPLNHQTTMPSSSSSPPRPSSALAPRPSGESLRSGSHTNLPLSNSHSGRPSPQAPKMPQQNHSDTNEQPSPQVVIPSVEVKTERPSTPDPPQPTPAAVPRHRPRKLDLTTNISVPPGRPSAPMTAKDSAPLTAMQDIGLACLSPGFQTEDPRMSQQLQRSMDLREQQRQIIEARLQKSGKDGGESSGSKAQSDSMGAQTSTFSKPPGTSRRKGPPPGLTITAPSASQFASEPRVIQSAPLHQSFTGLHTKPGSSHIHPLSRQVLETSHQHRRPSNQPPSASRMSSSQQYTPYVSTPQTATRLPPIQDVFANENLGSSPYRPSHTLARANSGPGGSTSGQMYAPLTAAGNTSTTRSPNSTQYAGALPSPAYPPPPQSAGLQPPSRRQSARDSEFRSADEAVHAMAGGREELLPKLVHYGGHQPPTPPSPLPPGQHNHSGDRYHHGSSSLKAEAGADGLRSMSGRRRTRDEYERDYIEREAAEGDRMDVDSERERGRNPAPSKGNGEFPPGLGFGFGSWSAEDRKRRSPETMMRKKEEFMTLCSRAWDLMHE